MGRLNSTIIDDKKVLHRRTVLYSHSKKNRNCYPAHTHTLFLNTTRCFGGLGYISTNLSIFVVSIGVTIFTNQNLVNSPQHPKTKTNTNLKTISNCVVKRNLTLANKSNTPDEQWEKDLEAELQDFEVVNDGAGAGSTNWEKDVDELLEDDDDETDLK